jgi:uncharacterized ion transporter superfamily protein YfcC
MEGVMTTTRLMLRAMTTAAVLASVPIAAFAWAKTTVDVPEPSTLVLMSLGLSALGYARWLKRGP